MLDEVTACPCHVYLHTVILKTRGSVYSRIDGVFGLVSVMVIGRIGAITGLG